MVVSSELENRFFEIIEMTGIPWEVIDHVATSDPNILRPIKGVCFEELFRKLVARHMKSVSIAPGIGDSDIDLNFNSLRLQLKTCDKGSTKRGEKIGVALHKTHGREKRPYNLYRINDPVFDFLVVLHPDSGIMIVPWDDIPTNENWNGYLADPATFPWNNLYLNRWDYLGFTQYKGKSLEIRNIPKKSLLPKLSTETFLEDFQIIDVLCRPEYFRAAVMGLKGNIKEHWMKDILRKKGYTIFEPVGSYPKYDLFVEKENGTKCKVQVKGTSKNMCDANHEKIGVEVMGTHGQFPMRGYKRTYFDYIVIVISEKQLNSQYPISDGLHFLFIPVEDLPLHYLIGNGDSTVRSGWSNSNWNNPEYNDVLYPNIKLKSSYNEKIKQVEFRPDIISYGKYRGYDIIPQNSIFRTAGPYVLDNIPNDFKKNFRMVNFKNL